MKKQILSWASIDPVLLLLLGLSLLDWSYAAYAGLAATIYVFAISAGTAFVSVLAVILASMYRDAMTGNPAGRRFRLRPEIMQALHKYLLSPKIRSAFRHDEFWALHMTSGAITCVVFYLADYPATACVYLAAHFIPVWAELSLRPVFALADTESAR